jgi:hypothetical protein
MDFTYWSRWPGTLIEWKADWIRTNRPDPSYPPGWLATDSYFQLATRPMFELWDNEPLTDQLRSQASPEQVRLFAVYVSDNDLNNGGFWQWLSNSYSCLYPQLVEGHRMLGLPGIADLVEEVVREVFPETGLPLDHDNRLAALEELTSTPEGEQVVDRLEPRDQSYYHPDPSLGYSDNEELLPLMCHWIDQHPSHFFTGAPPT